MLGGPGAVRCGGVSGSLLFSWVFLLVFIGERFDVFYVCSFEFCLWWLESLFDFPCFLCGFLFGIFRLIMLLRYLLFSTWFLVCIHKQ